MAYSSAKHFKEIKDDKYLNITLRINLEVSGDPQWSIFFRKM